MATNFRRTAHPADAIFDQALRLQDPAAGRLAVREQVLIRVSVESLRHLTSHLEEAVNLFGDHPVAGPFLESLPPDIFTHDDESYRLARGLIRVEERHTHPDAIGNARVGFVACPVVDGVACLILFVANSSREDQVRLRGDQRGNAWAGLVRSGWRWAKAALRMRLIADDRMGRDEEIFAAIMGDVRDRPGALLYWGTEPIDPHRDAWRAVIGARRSADEDDSRRARTTAGACRALRAGKWRLKGVPIGTRYPITIDVRGLPVPDSSGFLEPDPDQTAWLVELLQGYANGLKKSQLAVSAAEAGARDGNGRLLAPRLVPLMNPERRRKVEIALRHHMASGMVTAAELDAVAAAALIPVTAAALRRAHTAARDFVNRALDAVPHLRSGVIDLIRVAPTKGRLEYLGWYPTYVVTDSAEIPEGRADQFVLESELGEDHPFWKCNAKRQKRARERGFWRFQIHCGTAVILPDESWAAIDVRRKRGEEQYQRRSRAAGQARPLTGLSGGDEERRWRVRHGGDHSTYVIDVFDPTDEHADWVHQHTVHADKAAKALGELLLRAAERAEQETLPLVDEDMALSIDPVAEAEKALQGLRAELVFLEARAVEHHNEGVTISTDDSIDDNVRRIRRDAAEAARGADEERMVDLTEHLIPEAEAEVALARQPTSSSPDVFDSEEVGAEFATVTAVGLGLLRCDPLGPSVLSDTLAWMLDEGEGLRNLRIGSHDRQILFDVRIRTQLTDGTIRYLEVGTLDLTDHRLSSSRTAEFALDAARRLLDEGEPVSELAVRYGWNVPDVLQRVVACFAEMVPRHYLRAAIVTAAAAGPDVPVGKIIYAHLVGDDQRLASLREQYGDWLVNNIEAAYLGPESSWAHGSGWIRRPLAPNRAAMMALAQSHPVRRETLVNAVPGLNNDERLKDDVVPGRTPHWQPPYTMVDGWVSPHICEHADCPGGGAAPMTGLLPVPELLVANAAVFCEHCHRPLGHDAVLHSAYTRRWDVEVVIAALGRGDGIATVVAAPEPPTLPDSLLRTRDVVAATGLPDWAVHRLAADGEIPSVLGLNGKRRYDPKLLKSPKVRGVIDRAREAHGAAPRSGARVDDELLGSAATAEYLGLDASLIRYLVRTGSLANRGSVAAPAYRRSDLDALLGELREITCQPDDNFSAVATATEVAERFAMTRSVVTRMLAAGVVRGLRVGQLILVVRSSIDDLPPRIAEALDPDRRLLVADVAALAAIHETTVSHHVSKGTLPAVQLYPRARLFFLRNEVDEWLAARTAPPVA